MHVNGGHDGAHPLTDLLSSLQTGEDHTAIVDRAVEAARRHLGMDVSFLSEFHAGDQVYRRFSGDADSFRIKEDADRPLEGTYCRRVLAGTVPGVIPDTAAEPAVRDLPVTAEAGIGAYVGVPVSLPSGALYGTLCCLSHEADPSLGERDVRFLEVIAAIVGESLGERQAELERRRRIAGDIGRVLSDSALSIHFQPIVSLRDMRLAGVEALARFTCAPYRSPHHWFADAWEVGLGAELELMASSMALAALDSVPDAAYLSINVSPTVVSDPRFEAQLRACPAERVVIEVTEHAVAQHSGDLRSAMTRLRRLGLRFAVDDLGAGYAGLSQALVLAPEIIKLDRFLISGIDGDLARQALSAAVVDFAGRMGTRVIAEGVETAAEARVLLEIGIRYAQGFHLGRPAAVPHPPAA